MPTARHCRTGASWSAPAEGSLRHQLDDPRQLVHRLQLLGSDARSTSARSASTPRHGHELTLGSILLTRKPAWSRAAWRFHRLCLAAKALTMSCGMAFRPRIGVPGERPQQNSAHARRQDRPRRGTWGRGPMRLRWTASHRRGCLVRPRVRMLTATLTSAAGTGPSWAA